MRSTTSFLKSKPVFFILLPLFFVFNGFTDNYNAIPAKDALVLFLTYSGVSLFFFAIGWLFYREPFKAAIFSLIVMSFHFFFGAIQDLLKNTFGDILITRYIFLFPFFLVVFVLLAWLLKKTKTKPVRLGYYLNILLCVFILIDVGLLIQKIAQRHPGKTFSNFAINCDSCVKPDIYFLVFDEYSSSSALKEALNYDNGDLDSFLVDKGFRLLPFSRSNYNFTEFSIASTLNMEYLEIPNPSACTVKDYNYCFERIKSNAVCSVLTSAGYEIINHSIFDLPKNPTPIKEDFLPLKTKLITSQTFLSRIKKDLYYHLVEGRFAINWLSKDLVYSTYYTNKKVIEGTLKAIAESPGKPRFLYAHVEMPHPPYYFDKYGNEKTREQIVKENREMNITSYLDYLPKTNEVVKQIVNKIFSHSKRPFAIILLGDHGYRSDPIKKFQFRNLNAVYFSTGKYNGFYDSITNVNEYRVLFNTFFNTSLPLKKDSTIFLVDK